MSEDAIVSTITGALYGLSTGMLLLTLGSHAIDGPVAGAAQFSILSLSILPGAALGLLSHFERA